MSKMSFDSSTFDPHEPPTFESINPTVANHYNITFGVLIDQSDATVQTINELIPNIVDHVALPLLPPDLSILTNNRSIYQSNNQSNNQPNGQIHRHSNNQSNNQLNGDSITSLSFPSATFSQSIIGRIDLSNKPSIDQSNKQSVSPFSWLSHLSVSSVIIDGFICDVEQSDKVAQSCNQTIRQSNERTLVTMIRTLSEALSSPYLTIYINMPLSNKQSINLSNLSIYHRLLHTFDFSGRIKLILSIHQTINLSINDLSIYKGDVIGAINLSIKCFSINTHGYPVLESNTPQSMQSILQHFLSQTSTVLLSGFDQSGNQSIYQQSIYHMHYLHTLRAHFHMSESTNQSVKAIPLLPYQNIIQSPLQPLFDHLENAVYEVFEADSAKYEKYTEALISALRYIQSTKNTAMKIKQSTEQSNEHYGQSKTNHSDDCINVYVVGAGRGPLIDCSLIASSSTNLSINIIAFEKNPHALATLHAREFAIDSNNQSIKQSVTLIGCDIRQYHHDQSQSNNQKATIVVSELLGSFGDNELSPECLDCAQDCLIDGGISIPQRSVSYIEPIYSHRLYATIKQSNNQSNNQSFDKAAETPYVCQLSRYRELIDRSHNTNHSNASAQPSNHQTINQTVALVFEHPKSLNDLTDTKATEDELLHHQSINQSNNQVGHHITIAHYDGSIITPSSSSQSINQSINHNRRFVQRTFRSIDQTVLSAFKCTFTARLFDDVILSTYPDTQTNDMYSWFPMFLPLSHPINVSNNQTINLSLWRCCDEKRVWYEWQVITKDEQGNDVHVTHVHNMNGRASFIGL